MQFPEGTLQLNQEGELKKVELSSSEVVPAGVTYVRKHTQLSLPEGRKLKTFFKYNGDGMTYFVPLRQGSFEEFVGRTEAKPDEVYNKIKTLHGGDKQVIEQFDEFFKGLGMTQQGGNQKPSSNTATSTSYTNRQKVRDANGNLFEIGVKNGKWYNIATGKEVN